jgi:hypothetical protein
LRKFCQAVAPSTTLFSDLELDDIRVERFDGIEDTLYGRLRDPWNYSPMPVIAMSEEEEIENAQRQITETSDTWDIRSAADMLRTKALKMVQPLQSTGDSEMSEKMPSILHQEPTFAQKQMAKDDSIYKDNWESRLDMEKSGGSINSAAAKEKALMEGVTIPDIDKDVFRKRKNGKKAKDDGGGSQWDEWDRVMNGDDDKSSISSARSIESRSNVNKDHNTMETSDISVKASNLDSYHAGAAQNTATEDLIKLNQSEKKEDQRFAPRKVGGYSVMSKSKDSKQDQWAGRQAPGPSRTTGVIATPSIRAAGGSFSQGSGPLARQNTMQGDGGALGNKQLISPVKRAGLALDLSKVVNAPANVKIPSQKVKNAGVDASTVPLAPTGMKIPLPRGPNGSDGPSRPSSGVSRSSTNSSGSRPNSANAPIAPANIPKPISKNNNNRNSPPQKKSPYGGPQSNTLNFQTRNDSDSDDGSYKMDVGATFDPMASLKGGPSLAQQLSGGPRGGGPRFAPRASPPRLSANIAAAVAGASTLSPGTAPPAYSTGTAGQGPRGVPAGFGRPPPKMQGGRGTAPRGPSGRGPPRGLPMGGLLGARPPPPRGTKPST